MNHLIKLEKMSKYKFIENILSREINIVLQLNKYADFSINKIDNNHAYRVAIGMLSKHEIEKIQSEIEKFDNEETILLVQKGRLYKIFQEYTDLRPIGYVLYKLKNSRASSYYFDDNFKLLAKKYIDNSITMIEATQGNRINFPMIRNDKFFAKELNCNMRDELARKIAA